MGSEVSSGGGGGGRRGTGGGTVEIFWLVWVIFPDILFFHTKYIVLYLI